ncbi:MAG: alanine dehydrogenase [Coprobacillaceae bacterium]
MKIGCVKEIKRHEYRVGCTPATVFAYVKAGHEFYMESTAGDGSGFSDAEYKAAGAIIIEDAASVWKSVDMIIKVKEPLESEYQYFREGLILYTYLHLAANTELTEALMKHKVTGVAYETLYDHEELPLLKPMSEVAGKLSVQEAAKSLEKPFGGSGILLGGVPGVKKGKVIIIGGGVVGVNAAKAAIGIGADVVVLDKNLKRLAYLDDIFGNNIQTLYSTDFEIEEQCKSADVVIGAVLIPGAAAPKLVKKEYLKNMKPGSVIVDVAVDQGGCIETTKATYHDNPTFVIDGVVHYCVANMPGAVPRTSTMALTNATLAYGLEIANKGIEKAIDSKVLSTAINTYKGYVTYAGVAEACNKEYVELNTLK